jgi:hypothetical protein
MVPVQFLDSILENPLKSSLKGRYSKGHGTWFTAGLWPITVFLGSTKLDIAA